MMGPGISDEIEENNAINTQFPQAESDHHVRDTYNYVTIQTDIRMPARHTTALLDDARQAPFLRAIAGAVAEIASEEKDVRVLNLGAGAGNLQFLSGYP